VSENVFARVSLSPVTLSNKERRDLMSVKVFKRFEVGGLMVPPGQNSMAMGDVHPNCRQAEGRSSSLIARSVPLQAFPPRKRDMRRLNAPRDATSLVEGAALAF
jgi:hypothetical protein